jgi:pyrroline-5-carboxylate reductase
MKITFLGGGNMASALIGGLLKQGFSANEIKVVELLEAGRERLRQDFGVDARASVDEAALDCDVLLLAIKPQQMQEGLAPLAGRLGQQLVISIAAGLRLHDLSLWLGGHTKLVRAMPNTPALIGKGVTGMFAHETVLAKHKRYAETILNAVGCSVWVEQEALIDAVTALSGSGPAYVFYFIEALQSAGEALGLTPDNSRKLAIETLAGASALAAQSDETPAVLRERVTSKGGTTEAALKSLAADEFAAVISRALQAAANRGRELGDILGQPRA